MHEVRFERHRDHFERAQILLDMGQTRGAIEELQADLAENPDSPDAETLLALALAMQEDYQPAEFHVRNALSNEPYNGFSHYVFGLILMETKRDEAAEREFLEAIRIMPIYPDFHAIYAWLLYRNGQVRKAEKIARNALKLDPENVEALRILGHLNIDDWRVDVAQDTFRRALAVNPESSASHAGMGLSYLHQNDKENAHRELRESLRLDPTNEYSQNLYLNAVKARHPLYAVFWRWSLMTRKMGQTRAIVMILGFWFLYTVTLQFRSANFEYLQQHPFANYGINLLIYFYILFAIYTWIADPLFSFLARRGWIK